MAPDAVADILVDARGLACPQPVIALAKAVRDAPPGTIATVECTDAAARHDVPAWARLTGNEYLGERPLTQNKTDGGAFALTVRLVR